MDRINYYNNVRLSAEIIKKYAEKFGFYFDYKYCLEQSPRSNSCYLSLCAENSTLPLLIIRISDHYLPDACQMPCLVKDEIITKNGMFFLNCVQLYSYKKWLKFWENDFCTSCTEFSIFERKPIVTNYENFELIYRSVNKPEFIQKIKEIEIDSLSILEETCNYRFTNKQGMQYEIELRK